MMGWNEEIKKQLGGCGERVRIGHNVIITQPQNVYLGDDVRIDPFTLITSKLETGNYVHICSHVVCGGSGCTVRLGHWTFLGYGSKLFTESEDYSGNYGPVNEEWSGNRTDSEDIEIGNYGGIASECVLFPGVKLKEGTCVSIGNTVRKKHAKRMKPFCVYHGSPPRVLCVRNESHLRNYKWTENKSG
jgi:acetyltransferase-like isoleucine patch superfamily enzyme